MADESEKTFNPEAEWDSDGLSSVIGEGAGQLMEDMQKGEGQVGQDVALDSSFSPGVQSTPKNRRNRGRRERRDDSRSEKEEDESNEEVDSVNKKLELGNITNDVQMGEDEEDKGKGNSENFILFEEGENHEDVELVTDEGGPLDGVTSVGADQVALGEGDIDKSKCA